MRSVIRPNCLLCASEGKILFSKLSDWAFGSKGEWNILTCKNSGCGLQWVSPQPVLDDISEAYKKYYTHETKRINNTRLHKFYRWILKGYIKLVCNANNNASLLQVFLGFIIYLIPGRASSIEYLTAGIPVVFGGRLLEVGCGSGDVLLFLKSMGWHTTGIEVDHKAALIAQSKGLSVMVGDIHNQKFSDSSFDAIVINHVIEHLHDPHSAVCELRRLLKPSGKLVIVTPNTTSLLYKLFGSAWMPLDPPRHLFLFSSRNLTNLILDAGLEIISCRTSIRDSNNIFCRSYNVLTKNSYTMNNNDYNLITKFFGIIFQLFEWISLFFYKNAGEEVIIVATKSSNNNSY